MREPPHLPEPSDAQLDALLARLPRRFPMPDHTWSLQEERAVRRVMRNRRGRNPWVRAWIGMAASLALFAAGIVIGKLGSGRQGDLEAAIAMASSLSAADRAVLVQRAGTAYLRAVIAAAHADADVPDDRALRLWEPVRALSWAAAQVVGRSGLENPSVPASECPGSAPPSVSSLLVSF